METVRVSPGVTLIAAFTTCPPPPPPPKLPPPPPPPPTTVTPTRLTLLGTVHVVLVVNEE
jgi:hypothetical protein